MNLEVMLAWYNVADVDKAKKFYGDVLGLKPMFEMPGWAEFSHAKGATAIGLAAPRPDAPATPGATVVLSVDDMDLARKELSARGVRFDGAVEEIPGIVRLSTFVDPFGNRVQLAQSLVQQ
jgi:predicted enzyme related to lactoylglutathione lyase